jgi:hypothetical protein
MYTRHANDRHAGMLIHAVHNKTVSVKMLWSFLNPICKMELFFSLLSSVGLFLAAVVAKRAISSFLNGRRLRRMARARRQQHLGDKERFTSRFSGREMTEQQKEILGMDFVVLRQKLQEGEVSAVQVLRAYQAKAIEVDKRTNSVTEFLEDALGRAKGLDSLPKEARGPLHGIPISLKVRNTWWTTFYRLGSNSY